MTDEEKQNFVEIIKTEVTQKHKELNKSIIDQKEELQSAFSEQLAALKIGQTSLDEMKESYKGLDEQRKEVFNVLREELNAVKNEKAETNKLIFHAAIFFLGMILTVFGLAIILLESSELLIASILMGVGTILIVIDLLMLRFEKN